MSPSQSQELKQRALDLEAQAEDSTRGEAEIGRIALEAAKLHFLLAKELNEPPDPTRGNLPDPNSHINRAFLLIKRAKAMTAHGKFKWGPEEQRLQDEINKFYSNDSKAQPMVGNQIGQTEDYERIDRIKGKGLDESLLGGKTMKSVIVRTAEKAKSPWAVDITKKSSTKWSITNKSSTQWSIKQAQVPTVPGVPAAPSGGASTTGPNPVADPKAGKPIGGWSLMTKDGKPMGQAGLPEEALRLAQEVLRGNPEILDLNLMGPDGTFEKSITRIK